MIAIDRPRIGTRTDRSRRPARVAAGALAALLAGALCSCQPKGPATAPASQPANLIGYTWTGLFDGKTLAGWKVPQWGGDGKVYVNDIEIVQFDIEATNGVIHVIDAVLLP